MPVTLVANVGNRDVGIGKAAPLPVEINPHHDRTASCRALGAYLLQHWDACRPHLDLPIIGKAVGYVQRQEGRLDRVVLISSDQSGNEGVAAHHLAQDTCELARCVECLLLEQYGLSSQQITHLLVRHNPADYGLMQRFYRAQLALLRDQAPEGVFYLEVSGGTPAMTSMLLTAGAEVFGLAAHPLYVSEHQDEPFPLDLGRRSVAESLIRTVRANLGIYAYHAAARTVRDNAPLLGEFAPVEVLSAVLEYAGQRLNFNFEQAREALGRAPAGEWNASLTRLRGGLEENRPEWLLQEICHNARIKLDTGAYGDFLTRMFRFDEAAVRHKACELGTRLVDKKGDPDADGEFLDSAWLATERELDEYLDSKHVIRDSGGRIRANRHVLALIVAFWSKRQKDPALAAFRKRLNRIGKLSDVRNKCFAVHSFEGVSRQRMAEAFFGPAAAGADEEIEQIWRTVQEACELVTGQRFPEPGPYAAINRLVIELLAAGPAAVPSAR